MKEKPTAWNQRFDDYREDLLRLAQSKLSDVLRRRISPDDIVQETLKNACKRQAFFEQRPEIADMRKLQIILEQTICAMERRYLQSEKRDLYKEANQGQNEETRCEHNQFIDSAAGPFTLAVQSERKRLIRKALEDMPPTDRDILTRRIFLGLSNQECAIELGISEKNASIRFVRAMQRLQAELSKYTNLR